MAFIIGDVLKIRVSVAGVGGNIMQHVWHARVTSSDGIDEQLAIDRIRAQLVTHYQICDSRFNTSLVGQEVVVSKFVPGAGFVEQGISSFAGYSGTDVSESSNYVTSPKVFFGVEGSGRKGRKSMWPVTGTHMVTNTLTGSTITDFTTWALQFVTENVLTGISIEFGIFRVDVATFLRFAGSVVINSIVGSQTSRKEGRGI